MTPGAAEPVWAIGLMSGTSLDGIDAAAILTDGEQVLEVGPAATTPYEPAFRAQLAACLGGGAPAHLMLAAERALTERHAAAVRALAARMDAALDLVGFHGQTVLHAPELRRTWQLGDGARLARLLGLPVAWDFRSADVAAGGQGAPLAPMLHLALAAALPERPLAVLNLGGVGNVTWIGRDGALLAGDCGPGCALLDDWALGHTGVAVDRDGALARAGRPDEARLARWLAHPFFAVRPPKSLDRDAWAGMRLDRLSPADGAATLAAFTAAGVAAFLRLCPEPPARLLVCGGGRRNPAIMAELARRVQAPPEDCAAAGWDGDALEAQAFALLAVRVVRRLPLSLSGATGAPAPPPGGRLAQP